MDLTKIANIANGNSLTGYNNASESISATTPITDFPDKYENNNSNINKSIESLIEAVKLLASAIQEERNTRANKDTTLDSAIKNATAQISDLVNEKIAEVYNDLQ